MIYHATVNNVPYLEVSARNDDEARRRVIERCRRERSDGFCKRWKSGGMAVMAKSTNREEKQSGNHKRLYTSYHGAN